MTKKNTSNLSLKLNSRVSQLRPYSWIVSFKSFVLHVLLLILNIYVSSILRKVLPWEIPGNVKQFKIMQNIIAYVLMEQ